MPSCASVASQSWCSARKFALASFIRMIAMSYRLVRTTPRALPDNRFNHRMLAYPWNCVMIGVCRRSSPFASRASMPCGYMCCIWRCLIRVAYSDRWICCGTGIALATKCHDTVDHSSTEHPSPETRARTCVMLMGLIALELLERSQQSPRIAFEFDRLQHW